MISFKSSYISPAYVMQNQYCNKWNKKEVAFTKLSPDSLNDLQTINEIADEWKSIDNIESYIRDDFNNSNVEKAPFNFYAITKQKSKFDFLEPKDVLCIAETSNHDEFLFIDLLQAAPMFNYDNVNRTIKCAGSAMIECLKEITHTPIVVFPLVSATKFYEKLKFLPIGDRGAMIFKR